MDQTIEAVPYWLANVPQDQWEKECPEFLAKISERDKRILSTPSSQYRRLTWKEVKETIKTNRIDLFQREPTELRKYLQYTAKIKGEWGSIMDFVIKQRLQWTDLTPSGPPFSKPADIKVLYNDWPYGIDTDIVHLVVWVKFELEDDASTGDLTTRQRQQIDDYVDKTFCSRLQPENVIWFRNWASLKSISAVEHFHVMLNHPPKAFLDEITHGDMPMMEKLSSGKA